MPYIKQEDRVRLDPLDGDSMPRTPGELNYIFSWYIEDYVAGNGLSYQTINDVLGALDGASKEFYRRIAAPYEDQKIKENGDVF
jgi:hypothetical protein